MQFFRTNPLRQIVPTSRGGGWFPQLSDKLLAELDPGDQGQMTRSILCVEDDPMSLTVRKMVFESAGYKVLSASEAEHALHLVETETVDLVITDYRLPGVNGTELAAKIKEIFPHLPVWIISGLPSLPEGLGAADDFIHKMIAPQELIKRVDALLGDQAKSATG
jgi:DNA-binding response OmpR family regulator